METVEALAASDPRELQAMLCRFVEETGLDGVAPLPKEVAYSVEMAGRLPKTLEIQGGE